MKLNRYTLESDKIPKYKSLYIGIDQSLSCTSIAFMHDGQITIIRMRPENVGVGRLADVVKEFQKTLESCGTIKGAAIEGYAFSANGAKFNLGELGGLLRVALYNRAIDTIEVPPTHLKKFLTGKGTSQKNLMMKELFKKYSLDVDDDNDCDAVALALVCAEYFETELHPVKSYQTDTHKGCNQIIGEHPKPMDLKQYFKGMGDESLAQYEKRRKKQK